jgi:coproporphyrinogen III oxidase-like Fe-S oxidoreductase
VARYVAAIDAGEDPARELEQLDVSTRAFERLMLGLRLDEPLSLGGLEDAVDHDALDRLIARGMVVREPDGIRLAHAARLLGGAVTAELLA